MNTRETQIKQAQKFYVKIRAMHEDFVYLQSLSDDLKLDMTGIKIPLYEINLELRKYQDSARMMERDLDETQQKHFVNRENKMLAGGGI